VREGNDLQWDARRLDLISIFEQRQLDAGNRRPR
jgi:hypothetical protein